MRGAGAMLAAMVLSSTGAAVAMSAATLRAPVPARYSIAFVLTDDQDLTLASLKYMPKTRRLLSAEGGEGITFSSMFATTPVCCPSRSSYMSGMYQHNTRGSARCKHSVGHDHAVILLINP